jgi:hypothetical protein
LRRLQIAPERNRLQKLSQALEDGMVEARYLDREQVLLDCDGGVMAPSACGLLMRRTSPPRPNNVASQPASSVA